MTSPSEAIDVWLAQSTASHPQPALDLLSPAEQKRAAGIRHAAARAHFVTGRLLLRRALSHRAPIEPHSWQIETTPLGRPELTGPPNAPNLGFNLSHSGDIVACVVSDALTCGIDVESLDRPVDALGIARHSFAHSEITVLEKLAPPAREEHFFALWTLKEAYLKARGHGIRLRLDSARFAVASSGVITASLSGHRQAASWCFFLFEPAPGYRLAIALARPRPTSEVGFRTLDPDDAVRPLEVPLLAWSEH